MSLLGSIAGFSAFGFGVRCFQLGLQKRGIFEAPVGHLASAAAFGLVGYGVYYGEQRQNEMLAERKKVLQANRERELATAGAPA